MFYTLRPYHWIPPPTGYTSTGVGVSDGFGGAGASENATPHKGPILGLILGSFFALGEMFNCPGMKLTLVIKKPEINSPTMPEIGIQVSVSPRWYAIMGWYPLG